MTEIPKHLKHLTPHQYRKYRKGLCVTKFCRNPHRTRTKVDKNGNKRVGDETLCSKCRSRQYKVNRPYRYRYNSLKGSARKRGVYFGISFEDFKEWAIEENLLDNSGRMGHHNSVDRIIASKGYIKGNLQKLSISDNAQKYHDTDKWMSNEEYKEHHGNMDNEESQIQMDDNAEYEVDDNDLDDLPF